MKSKLIVALDVDRYEVALDLVEQLKDLVDIFKVGSQLFTRYGPRVVEAIREANKDVFLDLKFHDIPHTVGKAVEAAASLGVCMLTVHACGGAEMLRAAAAPIPNRPLIFGVTVLTSVAGRVGRQVLRLARLAVQCGLDGVVASPQELPLLRRKLGEKLLIVTPGIRPEWAEVGDQKRYMTPAEAVRQGANYIVVGRPIIAAPKPSAAALRIKTEMGGAMQG